MAEEKKFGLEETKPVFTWKATEFASYQKSGSWFFLIILAAILISAFFIWNQNWTAVGVTVAGTIALLSTARIVPKKISCSLYREGVVIDEKAHRFADLKSFWIIPGHHAMARFVKPGKFSMVINMPIDEEDPEQIRLFLAKYLPEESNRGEDLNDKITRWLKF